MTYTSLERTRVQTDLLASDLFADCPDCGDLAHPAATVCESCGSRLFPKNSNGPRRNSLDGMRAPRAEEVTVSMKRDELDDDGRDREPTDDEIYNRPGVEGGIAYDLADDSPGSLGENDWRL